jgi:hypothetical protein
MGAATLLPADPSEEDAMNTAWSWAEETTL